MLYNIILAFYRTWIGKGIGTSRQIEAARLQLLIGRLRSFAHTYGISELILPFCVVLWFWFFNELSSDKGSDAYTEKEKRNRPSGFITP